MSSNAPITISDLCDDAMRHIFDFLADSPFQASNCETRMSELQTLTRVSHVDGRWRSIILAQPKLWARNILVGRSTNVEWLTETIRRAMDMPVWIHIFDSCHTFDFQEIQRISALLAKLSQRCVLLHFEQVKAVDPLDFLLWSAAPSLQECRIVSMDPTQSPRLPFFANSAPNLKTLHLNDIFIFGGQFPDLLEVQLTAGVELPMAALIALGFLPRLARLDLKVACTETYRLFSPLLLMKDNVSFRCLEYLGLTGNPFSLTHILSSVALPTAVHISLHQTFDPKQEFDVHIIASRLWRASLRHFPSSNFPSCLINCSHPLRLKLTHIDGQTLDVILDDRALRVPTNFTIPLYFTPPPRLRIPEGPIDPEDSGTAIDPIEIVHVINWMTLRLDFPDLVANITTVVATSSPSLGVPQHLLYLLSSMVSVTVFHFGNLETACDQSWLAFFRNPLHPLPYLGHDMPLFPYLKDLYVPVLALGATQFDFREYIRFRELVGFPIHMVSYKPNGPNLRSSVPSVRVLLFDI